MAMGSQELERLLEIDDSDSCWEGAEDLLFVGKKETFWRPFAIEVVGELGSSNYIDVTKLGMTVMELKQAYARKVNKPHQLQTEKYHSYFRLEAASTRAS